MMGENMGVTELPKSELDNYLLHGQGVSMNIQSVTKKVSEQLRHDGVGGLNPGQIMATLIAAERCGFIKEPSNEVDTIDTKPCAHCNLYKEIWNYDFCPWCGKALSD